MSLAETPDLTAAWARFDHAAEVAANTPITSLFAAEPDRLGRLTLDAAGLFLDLSKQAFSLDGVDAGLALVRVSGVETARARGSIAQKAARSCTRPCVSRMGRSAPLASRSQAPCVRAWRG